MQFSVSLAMYNVQQYRSRMAQIINLSIAKNTRKWLELTEKVWQLGGMED